jgi:hypothetical protein
LCAEGKARWDGPSWRVTVVGDSKAVRHVVACTMKTFRGPFSGGTWTVDHDVTFRRVTVSEVTKGDNAIYYGDIRKRVAAVRADHELVLATLQIVFEDDMTDYEYLIVIDASGKIDAVFLTGIGST